MFAGAIPSTERQHCVCFYFEFFLNLLFPVILFDVLLMFQFFKVLLNKTTAGFCAAYSASLSSLALRPCIAIFSGQLMTKSAKTDIDPLLIV